MTRRPHVSLPGLKQFITTTRKQKTAGLSFTAVLEISRFLCKAYDVTPDKDVGGKTFTIFHY